MKRYLILLEATGNQRFIFASKCVLHFEPQFLDDRRNRPGTEIPELLPSVSRHRSGDTA